MVKRCCDVVDMRLSVNVSAVGLLRLGWLLVWKPFGEIRVRVACVTLERDVACVSDLIAYHVRRQRKPA